MKLTETILHKAAPHPVVAFDVFDTLIKRDVARPTDLFALLGADFAKARTQAEAEARAAGALEPRDGSEGPGQAAHLLLYLGGRALNQVGVVIGVVCHLVAFGRHPADLGGIEIEIRAI